MTDATFDRLVAEHQAQVLAICRSILRDEHLGADAAQEAFLRAWRQIAGGSSPSHPAPWLRRVAVTAAIDLSRRRAVRRDAQRAAVEAMPPATMTRSTDPARDIDRTELQRRLERGVATLPEGQRTIFLLRHEGGLSLREVAETLGLALTTVKTQFARACVKLQAHLRPFAPGPGDET